jgi:hypothetical protein
MRAALDAAGLAAQADIADADAVRTIDDAVTFAEESPLATGIIE